MRRVVIERVGEAASPGLPTGAAAFNAVAVLGVLGESGMRTSSPKTGLNA